MPSLWDPHQARFAQVSLLIEEGRSVDAGNQLVAAARCLIKRRDDDDSIDLARDAIEWAAELGVEAPSDLERAVKSKSVPPASDRRPFGRVLFIGGNETQQRYEAFLKEQIGSHWSDVHLETFYTGWSSNWGHEVLRIERRMDFCGAVVLMRFMRTMAGKRLRELCSQHRRPWVACTGHGSESLLRSIERAVGLLPTRG